jgi:hypothetical protein
MAVLSAVEITAWLANPRAIRGCLVEAGVRLFGAGADSTMYISSFSYTTGPSEVPANQYYESILNGGLKYTEKLDLEGVPALAIGDIELKNPNGEFDAWLDHTWINKPIKVYIGDPQWPRDSFFLIFDGVISDIDSRNKTFLNLKIKDKLARINTPINELAYSNVAPYPDSTNVTPYRNLTDPNSTIPDVPLCLLFGECFNITPVLIDTGNLIYLCHYGPIKGIVEVRDNGVPLSTSSYTVSLSTGTIKMLYKPEGAITVSLQGDNLSQPWDTFASGVTYRQTVGSIIHRLVTGYGKSVPDGTTGGATSTPSTERFQESDIDLTNFAAFETANPTPVGVFCSGRENLLLTCQQLANSVGAQLYVTRLGKLRLTKISVPPIGTPFVIDESHIKVNTFQIARRTAVQGSVKLTFCKNYTVQTGLLTRIPDEHKTWFAEPSATVLKADGPTITKYGLTALPVPQDTLLITQPPAYAEALRRLNLYKVPHNIYKFKGSSELLDLKLGDTVQLVNSRFGLTGAVDVGVGTVVSLQPDWSNCEVDVEVLV